uniref:Uncharacterized protein n=1 Tax=viral metagenome TaxID=1070528 RepID=A0A6C0DRP5_9ZZZZ
MNQQYISRLPREIQILIGEYNVDHRKIMNWVLHDIRKISHFQSFYWTLREIECMEYCDMCNRFLSGPVFTFRCSYNYKFCSSVCIEQSEWYNSYN